MLFQHDSMRAITLSLITPTSSGLIIDREYLCRFQSGENKIVYFGVPR